MTEAFDDARALGQGARCIVVHPFVKQQQNTRRTPEAALQEIVGLTEAIDLQVLGAEIVPLTVIKPDAFIGSGKIEELATLCSAQDIEVLVVDAPLSPIQQRNLERRLKAKVIDRTGLILEIFGARAQTREGRLQVDLAHLEYQKGRLVRSWTHLERQRGGVGFMGGPGERQIEADRRVLAQQIGQLKKELDGVVKTRELHRENRRRVPYPIVALVGYTNAGKSTLFNRLTEAEVMAEDMLFATLDPTMRQVKLPGGRPIILSDTVGFISDLPTQLVAAFRATLEEVREADIILHVRDIASPDSDAQRADVIDVLNDLDCGPDSDKIIIEILNKSDLLAQETKEALELQHHRAGGYVISAHAGDRIEDLLEGIEASLSAHEHEVEVSLSYADAAAASWLYDHARVLQRRDEETGLRLHVRLGRSDLDMFQARFPAARLSQKVGQHTPPA